MKLAMLACLAALCLAGPIAHAAPGEASKPALPAGGARSGETAMPHPAMSPGETAPAQARPHSAATPGEATPAQTRPPGTSARVERRRRSYAACNRASHQRGLRGGKRRRFLIRCRLGYERTRGQPNQSTGQAIGQPVQPGRRP